MKVFKKFFSLFLILIPINAFALIEVDITRGNLNPLPIAVSSLYSDKETTEAFKKEVKIDKIGEEISYLLTSIPQYESVRNYGRSCIIENLNLFFSSFFDFQNTKPVRPTYNTSLNKLQFWNGSAWETVTSS